MKMDNEIQIPDGLEDRLNTLIDRLDAEEKRTRTKYRRLWVAVGSAAACLLLLVATGLFLQQPDKDVNLAANKLDPRDTFTDTEQARREAEQALLLLSENFNKGIESLRLIPESMNQANDIIYSVLNEKNERNEVNNEQLN